AQALLERALAIATKVYGPRHADVVFYLHQLGLVVAQKGDEDTALAYFRRALDTSLQALGPTHPRSLIAMSSVVGTLHTLHRCADARPVRAMIIDALAKGVQSDIRTVEVLQVLGMCDLDDGQLTLGVERLERAMALMDKGIMRAMDRGQTR